MKRRGFTLIEVLVALTLFSIAMTVIWGAFRAVTQAWTRGGGAIEDLHHGDFLSEKIGAALRSAAWFRTETADSPYGFTFEDASYEYPADRISWVTASQALLPPRAAMARAMHRVELSIEREGGADGPALAVRAWPHLAREVEAGDVEPWILSPRVRGLDCRFWDGEREEWTDEWTTTNRLPHRVEIALYFDPPPGAREPLLIRRLVDLPVANVVTSNLSTTRRRRR
jgi:prepilin-type N-terminal cleavage/methylation domain-containing protein